MDNDNNELDHLEKREREEFQKNPFVNLAQSIKKEDEYKALQAIHDRSM